MQRRNVIICTDASISIGTEHVVNMMHVAEYLKVDWGIESHFLASSYLAQDQAGKNSYSVLDCPRKPSLEEFSDLLIRYAEEYRTKVILFDLPSDQFIGYEVLFKELLEIGYRLVFFNNFTRTRLLSYKTFNYIGARNYEDNAVPGPGMILQGLDYFVLANSLKNEFWKKTIRIKDKAEKILIHLDGRQQGNTTLKFLTYMEKISKDLAQSFEIVLERGNPDAGVIRKQIASLPNFQIHDYVDDVLVELIANCDYGLFGWGHICLEAMCYGMPFSIIPGSTSFKNEIEYLEGLGSCTKLGPLDDLSPEELGKQIQDMLDDTLKRRLMSKSSIKSVDGRGGFRVGSAIMDLFNSRF